MPENVWDWSKTASLNATADDGINWAEGQTPGSVNNSARSMMAAEAKMRDDQGGALTLAGGTTVYTLATNSGLTTLADGERLHAVVNATNTGASTLNVDSLGSKAVRKIAASGEVAIAAGDLLAGKHVILEYDASAASAAGAWILLNPPGMVTVNKQVFVNSGTYTPTSGMAYCIVECIGGGGAGGGATGSASTAIAGGGGGQGGRSIYYGTAATIGASKTVTIGAAGAGSNGATGGNGGTTSLGSLCVANGGSGGSAGQSGNSGQGGAGGAIGTGDVAFVGSPGGYGIRAGLTMTAVHGGMGGAGALGALAGNTQAVAGNAAGGAGAGGGGAATNNTTSSVAGGNGGSGAIIVTEFCQ